MPERNDTLVDEARAAVRGVFALVVGDRSAPRYFSFTQAGLVGSFIAVLIITPVELVFTATLGMGGVFKLFVQNALLYAGFLGATWLYLRLIGRTDALVPFMVATNWANAILSIVSLAVALLGLSFLGIALLLVGLIVLINTARLVMTLKAMQVVLLTVVQSVGIIAISLLILALFPPTQEQLAEIAAAAAALSNPPS